MVLLTWKLYYFWKMANTFIVSVIDVYEAVGYTFCHSMEVEIRDNFGVHPLHFHGCSGHQS